jgi:hypothetical protein
MHSQGDWMLDGWVLKAETMCVVCGHVVFICMPAGPRTSVEALGPSIASTASEAAPAHVNAVFNHSFPQGIDVMDQYIWLYKCQSYAA